MKKLRSILPGTNTLLIALVIAGCSSKPRVTTLNHPVPRTAGADLVFDGKHYSPTTREVLKREGLSKLERTNPAKVIQRLDQQLRESGQPEIRLAAAEVAIAQAFHKKQSTPGEILGYLLTSIELSQPGLAVKNPAIHSDLVEIYNTGNAELAWLLHQEAKNTRSIQAQGPLKRYSVGWAKEQSEARQPGFYETLTPSNRLKVEGFDHENFKSGVGGSVVGYRAPTAERQAKDPFMPPHSGYVLPLTSVVEWGKNNTAKVALHNLMEDETVLIDGDRYPLEGNFTASVATLIAASPKASTGLFGMMRPAKHEKNEGLYSLSPFRKDRTPLVLVHGLLSTPGTWREVVNACYSDPVIRENYQILVYFYATGFPIPLNAAVFRAHLKSFQEHHDPQRTIPKMREMVVIGHSMGCNLTNFQIRNGGDAYWGKFFDKPIEELEMSKEVSERLRSAAYFKANPDIDRVIFLCGPHRGSPLSNKWLGRLGARLIRLPFDTTSEFSGSALSAETVLGQSLSDESSSSINNLQANSPLLEALLDQPMPYKPKIHTIMGDRGKGDGVNSSDGVVPYWSAHLDGVLSEEFIPASHTSATNNGENVKAVRRILYQHLGKKLPADRE